MSEESQQIDTLLKEFDRMFTREYLEQSKYLISKMDQNLSIPIIAIYREYGIAKICSTHEIVLKALKQSKVCRVDEERGVVIPLIKPHTNTIIINDVGGSSQADFKQSLKDNYLKDFKNAQILFDGTCCRVVFDNNEDSLRFLESVYAQKDTNMKAYIEPENVYQSLLKDSYQQKNEQHLYYHNFYYHHMYDTYQVQPPYYHPLFNQDPRFFAGLPKPEQNVYPYPQYTPMPHYQQGQQGSQQQHQQHNQNLHKQGDGQQGYHHNNNQQQQRKKSSHDHTHDNKKNTPKQQSKQQPQTVAPYVEKTQPQQQAPYVEKVPRSPYVEKKQEPYRARIDSDNLQNQPKEIYVAKHKGSMDNVKQKPQPAYSPKKAEVVYKKEALYKIFANLKPNLNIHVNLATVNLEEVPVVYALVDPTLEHFNPIQRRKESMNTPQSQPISRKFSENNKKQ